MQDQEIAYRPIGVIHSPFRDTANMPIQPAGARGIAGTVVLDECYREGLKDLDGFSHIILIYHFHLSRGHSLLVKPFLDDAMRGVFASPDTGQHRTLRPPAQGWCGDITQCWRGCWRGMFLHFEKIHDEF